MMNKDSVTARDTLLSQISESFWIDSGTTTLNLPRSAQAPRRTACWTTFPTAVGRWLHFIFSASSHTKSTVISIRTPYVFRDYNFVGFSVCVCVMENKKLSFLSISRMLKSENFNVQRNYSYIQSL